MTEEYGIPEWGCYVIFAVLTIIAGLVLGLVSQQVYHLRVLLFSWICKAIFCQQSWRNKSYKCPCYSSQVNLYDYKVCSPDISYWWCLSILIFAPISRKLNFKLYTYVHLSNNFLFGHLDHWPLSPDNHSLPWSVLVSCSHYQSYWNKFCGTAYLPLGTPRKAKVFEGFCRFLLSNCRTYIE